MGNHMTDAGWLVLRHPAVTGGEGRCYGSLDLEADPAATAAVLDNHSGRLPAMPIVSSPKQRCTVLAARLAERFGAGFEIDDRLREIDFGAWEGLRWDQIDRAALDQWAAKPLDFRPPGGESAMMLLTRVAEFAADHPGRASQPLLIVTHGGVIRAMIALHENDPSAMLRVPPVPGSLTLLAGMCTLRPSSNL